jgi:type I restriction enzyme, S subunit
MESQLLSIDYLKQQPRWDFKYFDPKYLEVEKLLHQGKYLSEPLGKFTRQIQNFGAYSLCNLLKWVEDEEAIPYLKITNLKEDGIDWSDTLRITPEVHELLPKSKVYSGDVLYSMAGTIGLAVLASENLGECNSNQAIAKIRLKPDSLNPNYLVAFLNSRLGRYQSERIANGQTVQNINLGEIGKLLIPVPPQSLQDQIAQVMQEAYGDRQKKLEEAKKLLSSSSRVVLEELDLEISELKDEKYFTVSISKMAGGRFDLDLYNTRYTGLIALLQEKFDSALTPLKAISHQITSGATPLGSKYFESGVAFLRVQNLNDKGEIDFDDCLFVSEEFAKTLKRATIQNGDILLVIVGATIGKSAVVKDLEPPLVTNQALARIRIRETVDLLPEFLQAFLNSPVGQIQISSLKRPVAQGNLSLTETGQILVPMIPLNQQKKVISRVQAYRSEAKRLRTEAEAIVAAAKARVERMILGEDTMD